MTKVMPRLEACLPVARALALCIAALCAVPAHAGEYLKAVKARGLLRCGVSEGITGFSAKDAAGRWAGMDVDFCRAVAAATLGNAEKVQFVPLSSAARFPALLDNRIDLLARQTTWTLGREAGLKVRFAGVLLYDGQAFMAPAKTAPKNIAGLDGATICIEKGTTHVDGLAGYFAANSLKYTPLVIESTGDLREAFFSGRCRAYTSDASQLAAVRASAPAGGADYTILEERISKEPLGPVVKGGDEEWATLVRWVLFSLVAAEENGVDRGNVAARMREPLIKRALGVADESSVHLGIAPGWVTRAVGAVGNYGEMFERNLGRGSPLKLPRGLNRPWNQGGIMYAPPLR
ncbi:MAG: amino acid ABC transporter substrate-binding protein [Ramlibacter sp.]